MATIDTSKVGLIVDASGAVNAVSILTTKLKDKKAICHLTRGVNLSDPSKSGPAIRWIGNVDLLLGPGESRSGWDFNFLQFGNSMVRSSLWGGRTAEEGSVEINYAVPPAYHTNPSLDSERDRDPFTGLNSAVENSVPEGSGTRVTLIREFGDHPTLGERLEIPNSVAGAPNFLFNMRLDAAFTTVFVARDPKNVIQHLAHFTWHLIYDARFTWRGGTCSGAMVNGRLDTSSVTNGRPTDPTLKALLTSPTAPFYNDLQAAATTVIFILQQRPNCVRSATRDPAIPPNFFT
jgi:hypothetical protein